MIRSGYQELYLLFNVKLCQTYLFWSNNIKIKEWLSCEKFSENLMMKLTSLLGNYSAQYYLIKCSLFIILPIDIEPFKYFIGIAFSAQFRTRSHGGGSSGSYAITDCFFRPETFNAPTNNSCYH